MNSNPIQLLEDEHLIIAKVIAAVPVLADRLEAGQTVDLETLLGAVEFLQIFADKCHHDKEEDLLFPALINKGIPQHGCPIGMLTTEHKRGRVLVKELTDAADTYRSGDPDAKKSVVKSLRELASLYPNHIWKEDYLLFPLTSKVLSLKEQQALYQQFEQVWDLVGRGVHHRLEQFAEGLSERIQIC